MLAVLIRRKQEELGASVDITAIVHPYTAGLSFLGGAPMASTMIPFTVMHRTTSFNCVISDAIKRGTAILTYSKGAQ